MTLTESMSLLDTLRLGPARSEADWTSSSAAVSKTAGADTGVARTLRPRRSSAKHRTPTASGSSRCARTVSAASTALFQWRPPLTIALAHSRLHCRQQLAFLLLGLGHCPPHVPPPWSDERRGRPRRGRRHVCRLPEPRSEQRHMDALQHAHHPVRPAPLLVHFPVCKY